MYPNSKEVRIVDTPARMEEPGGEANRVDHKHAAGQMRRLQMRVELWE